MNETKRELISRNAAAKLRGVTEVTILNWVKHGHLKEATDPEGKVIRVEKTGQTFYWSDEVLAVKRPPIGRPREKDRAKPAADVTAYEAKEER